MMYGYGYGHMLGFGIFGGIISLIFWIAIIWLIVALMRGAFGGGCAGGRCGHRHWRGVDGMWNRSDGAMDTLRDRYVKGEISKEEFEEKSQVLKNSRHE